MIVSEISRTLTRAHVARLVLRPHRPQGGHLVALGLISLLGGAGDFMLIVLLLESIEYYAEIRLNLYKICQTHEVSFDAQGAPPQRC